MKVIALAILAVGMAWLGFRYHNFWCGLAAVFAVLGVFDY